MIVNLRKYTEDYTKDAEIVNVLNQHVYDDRSADKPTLLGTYVTGTIFDIKLAKEILVADEVIFETIDGRKLHCDTLVKDCHGIVKFKTFTF